MHVRMQPPVFAGMFDERPHELPGIPFAPMFRQYVQPEHALPFPVFLVEFGLLEHDVGNGTVIRHHAVYKADESPLILQQKEMTGKNLEPGGKRFTCACLAGKQIASTRQIASKSSCVAVRIRMNSTLHQYIPKTQSGFQETAFPSRFPFPEGADLRVFFQITCNSNIIKKTQRPIRSFPNDTPDKDKQQILPRPDKRDSIKPKVFEEREMGVRGKGEGNFL